MANTSREAVRDALATLLATELNSAGLVETANVLNYATEDLTNSPIVQVISAGSARPRLVRHQYRTSTTTNAHLYLEVVVFLVRPNSGESQTEAEAEDTLDSIEKTIADTLDANQDTANWKIIEYDGRTILIAVDMGGARYWMETIPVVATI